MRCETASTSAPSASCRASCRWRRSVRPVVASSDWCSLACAPAERAPIGARLRIFSTCSASCAFIKVRTHHYLHGSVYLNRAQLADVEGEPDAAWHLAELGLHYCRRAGDAAAIAKALFVQAERARRRGKQHTAYTYAHEGLNLVVAAGTDQTASWDQAFGIAARVELARIEGNYTVASQSADQYLALTDSPYHLFFAEDLIEQAEYALEADERHDALRLTHHALAIANPPPATALPPHALAARSRA